MGRLERGVGQCAVFCRKRKRYSQIISKECQDVLNVLLDLNNNCTKNPSIARSIRTWLVRHYLSPSPGENLGCFGGSKKKKEGSSSSNSTSPLGKSDPDAQPLGDATSGAQLGYSVPKGTEMLWSPEVSGITGTIYSRSFETISPFAKKYVF